MKKMRFTFKWKVILLFSLMGMVEFSAFSQVGINTNDPDSSAVLDLWSRDRGLLIPRMNWGQRRLLLDNFLTPAHSLLLFDTNHNLFYFLDATETSAANPKGTWKAVNPWTQRGAYANINNNAVYCMSNVGIGVENPSTALEVNGTTTTNILTATTRVNTNTVRARNNDGLQLFDNDNRGIFVEDGGRVGINVDDPNDRLDVGGNMDVTGAYKIMDQVVLSADERSNLLGGFGAGVSGVEASSFRNNTILGTGAGTNMTEGAGNVFLGQNAGGNSLNQMLSNVFIGSRAGENSNSNGESLTLGNVYVGVDAGRECAAFNNTFVGYNAGRDKVRGWHNVFIGSDAGIQSGNGLNNVAIGSGAGFQMGDGSNNTFLGDGAGFFADGDGNICIGNGAGSLVDGNCIIIGNNAGIFGTDKLAIGHGTTSLIEGDFTVPELTINGDLTVTGACSGCTSDSTLKTNIQPIASSLQKISSLKGYTFNWKEHTSQYKNQNELQIGFMAQEVQQAFPLLVDTASAGHLYVDYPKLVVPLVVAVGELKTELDKRDKMLEGLQESMNNKDQQIRDLQIQLNQMKEKEKQVEELKARMERLESLFSVEVE